MTTKLTRVLADRHEALYPRVERLARQVEGAAARRPGAGVPAATRAVAETLLYDLAPFHPGRQGLVAGAPDMGGLATQLGQALAALDVFETSCSAWHPELRCRVWNVDGPPLPVRRLRPQSSVTIRSEKEQRHSSKVREGLIRRMIAKSEQAYEEGYRDANLGVPMRASKL